MEFSMKDLDEVCSETEKDYENDHDFKKCNIRGLDNPKYFCFLNSVVQLLYACQKFRKELILWKENSDYSNDNNVNFTLNMKRLFCGFHKNKEYIIEYHNQLLQTEFNTDFDSIGEDIGKCFSSVLSKIKKATIGKGTTNFYDLFEANYSIELFCETCNEPFDVRTQIFNVIPVSPKPTLKECIDSFFATNRILVHDNTEFVSQCCSNRSLCQKIRMVKQPQYLFVCILRASCYPEIEKDRTTVCFNEVIHIEDKYSYKLIAVADHIGTSEFGHYFVKILCNDQWLLISDKCVTEIPAYSVQSNNAVGLIFEFMETFSSSPEKEMRDISRNTFEMDETTSQNCALIKSVLQTMEYIPELNERFVDNCNGIGNEVFKKICEIKSTYKEKSIAQEDISFLTEHFTEEFKQNNWCELFLSFYKTALQPENNKATDCMSEFEDIFTGCYKISFYCSCGKSSGHKVKKDFVYFTKKQEIDLERLIFLDRKLINKKINKKCSECNMPFVWNTLKIEKHPKYLLIHLQGGTNTNFPDKIVDRYSLFIIVDFDGSYTIKKDIAENERNSINSKTVFLLLKRQENN